MPTFPNSTTTYCSLLLHWWCLFFHIRINPKHFQPFFPDNLSKNLFQNTRENVVVGQLLFSQVSVAFVTFLLMRYIQKKSNEIKQKKSVAFRNKILGKIWQLIFPAEKIKYQRKCFSLHVFPDTSQLIMLFYVSHYYFLLDSRTFLSLSYFSEG